MKKMIACFLAAAFLILSLGACGSDTDAPTQETKSESVSAATQAEDETESTQTEPQAKVESGTKSEPNAPAQLRVQFAEDVSLSDGTYDSFTAEDAQVRLVFTTDRTVQDIQFLSLFVNGADDDGNLLFEETTLYTLPKLTPERALVIGTRFIGDLPNNGIAYTDADGTVRRFTVSTSGEDGSLILEAF